MTIDKEQFAKMLKEYLNENLQINIEQTQSSYNNTINLNIEIDLDGEMLYEKELELFYKGGK